MPAFQEAVSFIRKWQREVKKRLDRNDENLAVQSAKLREEEFKELRKKPNVLPSYMISSIFVGTTTAYLSSLYSYFSFIDCKMMVLEKLWMMKR